MVASLKKLQDLNTLLEGATSRDDLDGTIAAVRDLLGVDHVIYHSVSGTGEQYAALTYPKSWVEEYVAREMARIDPVIRGALGRFRPVVWKDLDWSSKVARNLFAEARTAGVAKQGMTMPIRGPSGQTALFTINAEAEDSSWARFCNNAETELILLSHMFNNAALQIDREKMDAPRQNLSPREIDALTSLALGMNRAQAADALSISEHTLRVYIEGARFKLGAANTTHAVARALSMGLLIV